jgi:flagellar export protein FliJ
MKTLTTLIKLRQRDLDRSREQLAKLESQRDQVIKQIGKLTEDLEKEYHLSAELADLRGFFGEYAESIKQKQKVMAQKVVQTEMRIQEVINEIQIRFAEVKKYEIALERRKEEEKQMRKYKEQMQMDEIGIRNVMFQEQ